MLARGNIADDFFGEAFLCFIDRVVGVFDVINRTLDVLDVCLFLKLLTKLFLVSKGFLFFFIHRQHLTLPVLRGCGQSRFR